MKVAISYPPLESEKGVPLLSQNRQFQWFNSPSYIYPIVPAYAATLLKSKGYDVIWNDAIAEKWSLDKYYDFLRNDMPDVIAIETKTPVVRMHWEIVNEIKKILPESIVVLMGDHATAYPEESLGRCKVDYVLTGGDYDFMLLNLCRYIEKKEELEPGFYHRKGNTGKFELKHDLAALPQIDRELTKWQLYKENGNYKHLPGTYTMAGRDCWYGKCAFCSWPQLYPKFRVRTPGQLLDEIGLLIKNYGIKEIMDDTGCFPVGKWLRLFCNGMIERGYNKKVRISCNMRFGALDSEEYKLMRKAGFRFVLYGLESANQQTLDRINKGIKVQDIIDGCRLAKKAGLDPHLTCMIGYPWENYEDAKRTIDLAKYIFNKGWADTLQATIVIPYPKTPLYQMCRENNWLKYDGADEWERYDMREAVMKSPLTEEQVKELTRELYKVFFSPKYVIRKMFSVRSLTDIQFIFRGVGKVAGHLIDFSGNKRRRECE